MTQIFNILTTLLAFGFALGVIIVVHEAGHLLVAKAFGVRVLTFSVGFGKRLWGVQRGETDYRVSAVPLGGYVRLGGENPEDVSPDDPREFLNKPRWQRILVYLAGPAANFVLSLLLFAGLFRVGIEVMSFPDMPPLVSGVEAKSSADQAGLKRGDLITAVNGEAADNWQDVALILMGSPGKQVTLAVKREDKAFNAVVTPKRIPRYEIGDFGGLIPSVRPQIIEVVAGQPAQAAGFKPGDAVQSVDGRPVMDSQAFVNAIAAKPGQRIDVQVVRDGKPMTLAVVPRDEGGTGKIGVRIGFYQRYSPGRAFVESFRYNVQTVEDIFTILGKVITRQLSAKSTLAGPIEIAAQSGEAARTGFKYLLHLMGFISISIAVMNLMPIPILDGGQIFILMVEGVIRRDLAPRIKEVISQVGFVMILLLMFVVIYFDLMKRLAPGS
jgi:regulator of sigma E protease